MLNNLASMFKQCIHLASDINIIIANGEPPKDEYLLHLLKHANCVICCDGAINVLQQYNIEPSYIIGDCDSLAQDQKQKYAAKIKIQPDQNYNDLTKAVDFALDELHLENIIILGATGLREDHSLANIALFVKYAQKSENILLLSDYGFFSVSVNQATIATVANQQISLFALRNDIRVTTHGLKWELTDAVLDSWHSGTLNETLSTSFELESSAPILVYRSFTLKN